MTTDRIVFAQPVVLEGRRLRGSVKLAGERTRRNGEWLEIDPAAIAAADASDIVGRWEHDPSRVLGRSSNGTVRFSATDDGIEYEIDLPETSYANDLLALAHRGDIRGSSFEIEGLKYSFTTDLEDGSRVRRITHIDRVTDVSPVTDPAFLSSTLAAFSKESEVTTPATEPQAPEAPAAPVQPAPAASQPAASETFAAAEKLARDTLRSSGLGALENALDSVIASFGDNPTPEQRDQYAAIAKVYDEQKAADAEAKQRREAMKLAHDMRRGRLPKAPETGLYESEDYKHSFGRYLRGEASALEQFAQSIAGDGTQGGYMVPEEPRGIITESMAAFGGIQQHADVLETSDGRPIPWPTNNDTANSAAIASEGSAVASGGADLVFGEILLGAFSYSATGTGNAPLKVSWELLQDAAFDVEAFVARKLGERLGRKMAADYANGVGTTAPFGLLAKTPDSMTATTLYAALVEHMFQVNEAYRNAGNCRWIMSDTTLTKVYQSVDLQGRPLFIPAGQSSGAGAPAGTLLGFPVQLDQAAANNVAFGDIRQGYVIRRVTGIQVVVDPYNNTAARQTAYHAWARTDANVQDSAAYSVSDYSGVSADATS